MPAERTTQSTLYFGPLYRNFGPLYRKSPFFERTLAAGASAYDSSTSPARTRASPGDQLR